MATSPYSPPPALLTYALTHLRTWYVRLYLRQMPHGEPASHHLGWEITLSARSTVVVGVDFVKPLRHIDGLPADSSRGVRLTWNQP